MGGEIGAIVRGSFHRVTPPRLYQVSTCVCWQAMPGKLSHPENEGRLQTIEINSSRSRSGLHFVPINSARSHTCEHKQALLPVQRVPFGGGVFF